MKLVLVLAALLLAPAALAGPITCTAVPTPCETWSAHLEAPPGTYLTGTGAAIADGRVFAVWEQSRSLAVPETQHLRAFAQADGRLLWDVAIPASSEADRIATDGARVFVARAQYDGPERILAVDAATGATAWDAAVQLGVLKLTMASGGVLVATGQVDRQGEYRPAAAGIDATTGAVLWRWSGSAGMSYRSAAVSGDGSRLFMGVEVAHPDFTYDAAWISFDAVTGQRIATASLPYRGSGPLVLPSPDGRTVGVVYEATYCFPCDLRAAAFDASTGARLWERTIPEAAGAIQGGASTATGFVAVTERSGVFGYRPALFAFNYDGSRTWTRDDPDDQSLRFFQGLVASGPVLHMLGDSGMLVTLSAASGDTLWRATAAGGTFATMAAAPGALAVVGQHDDGSAGDGARVLVYGA